MKLNVAKAMLFIAVITLSLFTACSDEKEQDQIGTYEFDGLTPLEGEEDAEDQSLWQIDQDKLVDLIAKSPQNLRISLDHKGKIFDLDLSKADLFTEDFVFEDENGTHSDNELIDGIFYQGKLADDEHTTVSLSILNGALDMDITSLDYAYSLRAQDGNYKLYRSFESDNDIPVDFGLDQAAPLNPRGSCYFKPIRIRYVLDYSFIKHFNNSSYQAMVYVMSRFNQVRSIYGYWGFDVRISHFKNLSYSERLQSQGDKSNILGDLSTESSRRFGKGSNHWEVNASLVAVDASGGTTGTLIGGGYATVAEKDGTAPICKTGRGIEKGNHGYLPTYLVGLSHKTGTTDVRDDLYFTFVLAHELGHNFGIGHEFDGVTRDIMDHSTDIYNSLLMSYTTYVKMYNAYASCYYTCN